MNTLVAEVWRKATLNGLHSLRAIAQATGIKYDTLCNRMKHPEKFTIEELLRLHKEIQFDLTVIGEMAKKGR